jgi:hypothetical protein
MTAHTPPKPPATKLLKPEKDDSFTSRTSSFNCSFVSGRWGTFSAIAGGRLSIPLLICTVGEEEGMAKRIEEAQEETAAEK